MIEKVECVALFCDNCGDQFEEVNSGFSVFADVGHMHDEADDDGWYMHHENGKHYCDKCHHINDDDEFVLNTERTKKSPDNT